MPDNRRVEILLVDDNAGDVQLMQAAFQAAEATHNLSVAKNGTEALAFVRRQDEFAAAPRPNLILLDLNMPGMHGFEVLSEIKGDASLKRIPVIILTSSEEESDVLNAYDRGANGYIKKPLELDTYDEIASSIVNFWLQIGTIP